MTLSLFVGGEAPYVTFDIWRLPYTISNNSEGQARKMALVGFPKEGTFSFDHFVVLTLHQCFPGKRCKMNENKITADLC